MMANMTGHAKDAQRYSTQATDWIKQWQQLAVNQNANAPHTVLNYGHEDSFSLLYNLWADALLDTQLVPRSIYQMQSDFYPTVAHKYGVPLDTRARRGKNDWEMFCAAIAEQDTREMFLRDTAKFLRETPTSGPATDLFEVDTGGYGGGNTFRARPVVGGWFALLALRRVGIPDR